MFGFEADPSGHPRDVYAHWHNTPGTYSSSREVRGNQSRILATRKVLVDGRVVVDHGRAIGLMDVLTVGDDNYRCVLDTNGKLRYRSIRKKHLQSPAALSTRLRLRAERCNTPSTMDEHSFRNPRRVFNGGYSGHIAPRSRNIGSSPIRGRSGGLHDRRFARAGDFENQEIEIKRSTRPNVVVFDEFRNNRVICFRHTERQGTSVGG